LGAQQLRGQSQKLEAMPSDEVSIPEDTHITCSASSISEDDLERLTDSGILADVGLDEDEEDLSLGEIEVNIHVLAEFAYRYETLERVASDGRVDVLHYFRDSSDNKHLTGEIADELEIHPSTASRHLRELTDAGYLRKIQRGVYALNLD
jgi:DNA-binding MarR family transcriptional regulator